MSLRLERFWFNLTWHFAGDKIGSDIHPFDPKKIILPSREHTHGFVLKGNSIYIYAPPTVSDLTLFEIINHEVLHQILNKVIGWDKSKQLDKVHDWKNGRLCFIKKNGEILDDS